jgi:hypothetical protein
MMQHLKRYLTQQKTHRQARQWLTHSNSPDRIAAHCLFLLNRLARRTKSARGPAIYSLKNRLLRHFYERGYCVECTRQSQTLHCWHTREYNEGWEDECYKCEGTGIYRQHHLYRFVFIVAGQRYIWHQPDGLVDWPVTVTSEEVSELGVLPSPPSGLNKEMADLYQATLYEYLREQGADRLPGLISLRDVYRRERQAFTMWRRGAWYDLYRSWRRFVGWLEGQATLKRGDVVRTPYNSEGEVLQVDWIYQWPYSGQFALVELKYAGNVHSRYPVERLTPLNLRPKLYAKVLGWANRLTVMVFSEEDEIPF